MSLSNPLLRPLTTLGLELVVIALGLVTLEHARRRGALFAWLAVVSYGVAMDILSYHAFDNFWHARMSVMLYHDKLPLYVVFVYPVMLYTGMQAVGRLGLGRVAEPFAAGLAIVLLDVPYDVLGAGHWWSWSSTDPNLHARWAGVPVTSFYWHIAFGGCLAMLVRAARGRRLWLAPLAGIATIPLGMIAFVPFHVAHGFGVPDGASVAALAAASAVVLVGARRRAAAEPDALLRAVPFLFHGYLLVVLARFWWLGQAGATAAALVLAATALSLALHTAAHARARRGALAARLA